MDWTAVIERNREALRRVLAALMAMAGLSSDNRQASAAGRPSPIAATLPRHLHRAVLRLLRPAEAAARRLVILAARGIVVAPPPPLRGGGRRAGGLPRRPCLPLFDTLPPVARRRAPTIMPRISLPGITRLPPVRPAPMPFDRLDATRLALRLAALGAALDDLPRHARRFARWRAMRGSGRGVARSRRVWPLRPGRPPGRPSPGVQSHAVHDILDTVHGLALLALEPADTS